MKMEFMFSVIIPVYNVENYLAECVNSVLSQTYHNLEIILVDDGSTDKSGTMCDVFAETDQRIQVVHKKNGGLSDARNYGLRRATGDYVLFLDSDDYWDDPSALMIIFERLKARAFDADIAIFQAKLLYPDGSLIPDNGFFSDEFDDLRPQESLQYLTKNGLLIGSACSKAVRRDFLLENELWFKVGIKSEDIDWIIRVANFLPNYIYTGQYFYIYRKGRAESITSNVDFTYLRGFADMLQEYMEFQYYSDEVRECLLSFVAYEFSILMARTANLRDNSERKMIVAKLRKMQGVLNYDMNPKVKQVNIMRKTLGFNATMIALGLYLKYRKR